MDNEDREATPAEPSSSQLCETENSIDSYLSPEAPVIDSSHLFTGAFDDDETLEDANNSKSPTSSPQFKFTFDKTYNYNEAAINCQVDQSYLCENSEVVYPHASNLKQGVTSNNFGNLEIDDNLPGPSSSGNFTAHRSDKQDFHSDSSNSSFEPSSNQLKDESNFNSVYTGIDLGRGSEEASVSYSPPYMKKADSSMYRKGKYSGKVRNFKGKGKGKMSYKQSFSAKSGILKNLHDMENAAVESSNKHTLFGPSSSHIIINSLQDKERRLHQSELCNDNEIDEPVNTSSTSFHDFSNQKNLHHLSDDDTYMVASSSGGVNCLDPIINLKSPTTPGDSCLVSSSTGQLDSLPPTPINFQGNDACHSSPTPSPLDPPVLDSTVDSTSGQNLLSPSYSDEGEIAGSSNEFGCPLDEDRNEISTSVSHLQHGVPVDNQDLNLLVDQPVFVEEQGPGSSHFVGPFISLDNLSPQSLHSTLTTEKSSDEAGAELIPASSSAYLPDCLEIPGSSHMTDTSKKLMYGSKKDSYRSSLSSGNAVSNHPSSAQLNSINNISFNDDNALDSSNSEDLSHVGLIELRISEMEPESSSLVASSANLDNEAFPSTSSASSLSPSGSNFESGSTLAQLNQHYILGLDENSLSSDDGLSPQSISQTGPELTEGSLGLSQQLRETDDSLESTSNSEDRSTTFRASWELGLGPQQLRRIMESRQEPQSLIPPPHLLEEVHTADHSANAKHLDSPGTLIGTRRSNALNDNVAEFVPTNEALILPVSETATTNGENSFVIMVSEPGSSQSSQYNDMGSQFMKVKQKSENFADSEYHNDSGSHSKSDKESIDYPQDYLASSSLVNGLKENEKEVPYNAPNGLVKRDGETLNRLAVSNSNGNTPFLNSQEQPEDQRFPDCYPEKADSVGFTGAGAIPVNIHSLFNHRPSILKSPVTAKPSSSYSTYINHFSCSTSTNDSSCDDNVPIEKKSIPSQRKSDAEECTSYSTVDTDPSSYSRSMPSPTFGMNSYDSCEKDIDSYSGCERMGLDNRKELESEIHEKDVSEARISTGVQEHYIEPVSEDIRNNTECVSSGIVPDELELCNSVSQSASHHLREDATQDNEESYWCGDCNTFLKSKCQMHRVQTIMDKPVLTRAWASLPAQHLTIKQVTAAEGKQNGVFARKWIPKRTQFGPLEGQVMNEVPPTFGLLFKTTFGGMDKYLDISEEGFSNWMRFVRPADTCSQMNCVVIEESSFIYFLTTTNISSKSELRVGYSKQYAVKYNLPLLAMTEEEKTDIEKKNVNCDQCSATFTNEANLEDHTTSHNEGNKTYEGRLRKKARLKGLVSKQNSPPPPYSSRLARRSKVNRRFLTDGEEPEASYLRTKESEILGCSKCNLHFSQNKLLQLHTLEHNISQEETLGPEHAGAEGSEILSESRICPACEKNFETLQELVEHVKQHSVTLKKDCEEEEHQNAEYKLCFKSPTEEPSAKDSLSHKVKNTKPYTCFHCLASFWSKSALGSHLKNHVDVGSVKAYDCPICQEKFNSLSSLKSHLPHHYVNGSYTCPTCSKKFPSYHKIRRHIRSYHSAVHPCHECGKPLPSLEKLKVHLVSHSDRRDFACPLCQKRFKRKDKMKEHHKRIHTIKREPNNNTHSIVTTKRKANPKFVPKVDPSDYKQFMYKCDLCLLGFKRRGMLVNHLSKRHPNIPLNSIPELNQPILRTSRSYVCQYCGKVYVSTTKRKLHILKNHPGAELPSSRSYAGGGVEVGAKTTRTYAASCSMCPRQYLTKAKLLQHQRHHHGRGIINNTKSEHQRPHQEEYSSAPSVGKREHHSEGEADADNEEGSKEDILSQAFGKVSEEKTHHHHLVQMDPSPSTLQGSLESTPTIPGSQTVVELRVQQPEEDYSGGREQSTSLKEGTSSAPTLENQQVLVSPSLILPPDGAAYALLTPDGGDAFTLSLQSGQVLPSVGGFSVLSASSDSTTMWAHDEGGEAGPSSRLVPLDGGSAHSQFALELNGVKGESCVVAQVGGAENSSPVLVWQPSLSFTPSS